jgi:hypothetical protein
VQTTPWYICCWIMWYIPIASLYSLFTKYSQLSCVSYQYVTWRPWWKGPGVWGVTP